MKRRSKFEENSYIIWDKDTNYKETQHQQVELDRKLEKCLQSQKISNVSKLLKGGEEKGGWAEHAKAFIQNEFPLLILWNKSPCLSGLSFGPQESVKIWVLGWNASTIFDQWEAEVDKNFQTVENKKKQGRKLLGYVTRMSDYCLP